MNKYNLLDCTLRDGGYITNWNFDDDMICDMTKTLVNSNFDFVEIGYLNNKPYIPNTAQFQKIEQIADFIPENRKSATILAMADVEQFLPENLTEYTGRSIDGIRVVFYKHQIEKAIEFSKTVKENGYQLFVQPMVTIDYTIDEYMELAERLAKLEPVSMAIVDSFGYMIKSDFRRYFKILDNIFTDITMIGFHSHNNMNLSFITGQDILEYTTTKRLVLDCSLYGMGRGAGNLQTELIANYYNMTFGYKYDVLKVLDLISKYIMPIREKKQWGYTPYFFLTGLYHCHPNYVSYLLEEHKVSVAEFQNYIESIPKEMYTKCQKPYVLKMYEDFLNKTGKGKGK